MRCFEGGRAFVVVSEVSRESVRYGRWLAVRLMLAQRFRGKLACRNRFDLGIVLMRNASGPSLRPTPLRRSRSPAQSSPVASPGARMEHGVAGVMPDRLVRVAIAGSRKRVAGVGGRLGRIVEGGSTASSRDDRSRSATRHYRGQSRALAGRRTMAHGPTCVHRAGTSFTGLPTSRPQEPRICAPEINLSSRARRGGAANKDLSARCRTVPRSRPEPWPSLARLRSTPIAVPYRTMHAAPSHFGTGPCFVRSIDALRFRGEPSLPTYRPTP